MVEGKVEQIKDRPVLIEYFGDSKGFEPGPHGNAKKNNDSFNRSEPSIIEHFKGVLLFQQVSQTYRDMKITEKLQVRNKRVLYNIRSVS